MHNFKSDIPLLLKAWKGYEEKVLLEEKEKLKVHKTKHKLDIYINAAPVRSKAFLIKINQIKSTKNEIVLIFFPQCVLCASRKDERLNYYCIALQFGTLLGAFCCPVPWTWLLEC